MKATAAWIDGQVLIPDLLRAAPQARPVLDRYGLRGCGGEMGPAESLGFFARAHDVPLPTLLDELRRACESDTPPPAPPANPIADTIYRPFFKAGIAVVLTLGAAWGAYLLVRIALGHSFTSVGLHEVNAHGHAQIFTPGEPIIAADRVGDVLEHYPELLSTFVSFGFTPLTNPLLRKTVARVVTIETACRGRDVPVANLLAALNAARARLGGRRRLSLAVVEAAAPAPAAEPVEGACCPRCAGGPH